MEIELVKAVEADAEEILHAQVESFSELLKRYQDTDTNPANETVDRVLARINRPDGALYKVMMDGRLAGAICIYWKEEGHFWISPMFIRPSFQSRGIAQQVIFQVEKLYPVAVSWELATILEEEKNCYLYEKAGYLKTGVSKRLNDYATLVYYKKSV
ncbi:acetyltransferase [Jeotgalibacillus malaysiensis]|uniref:Acetyltransferase n=1 Tax=Jeotgalibacillus malaysiensis TaxID=1508404 RepID=A0A0B5ARJ4_9BACL|nr:GNAT family N-acetyltransferase [Jeotgalibacillus malaysiensis]AJD92870.1 acetyltransferase [Jeotgalibacillus malaysiensis]